MPAPVFSWPPAKDEKARRSRLSVRSITIMIIIRYTYPAMLARSKNADYRRLVTQMTEVLMRFLVDNELLLESPYNADGSLNETFQVTKDNLTDDGNRLFREYFTRWSDRIDRGGKPENIASLVKGLAKIRATPPAG